MVWYLQLTIYVVTISIAFWVFYNVDFHKFMRQSKKELSILVLIVVSIAFGYLMGKLLIELSQLFMQVV